MKAGILEVLLVYAKGIKRTSIFGKPSYYVILEWGNQSKRSKISSGNDEKTWWNEKFTFEFSSFDDSIKKLRNLKCTIMDTELFTNGGFVGESRIYIGRLISEVTEKGYIEIKPAQYNVVLEDDTYRGQIKIGFKLLLNKERSEIEAADSNARGKGKGRSIFGSISKLWRISWYKTIILYNNKKLTRDKNEKLGYCHVVTKH